ncbi:MAG: Na+/proline symporter [Candidatus Alkanophagales archaeon MCA70_species_1]|nr:Na+/proline symporter [Candidatus Alkanophaga volatiphilum]
MQDIVLPIVAAYLGVCMLIGLYGRKLTKSAEDFDVGGRRLPWWVASFSIAATLVGSGVTIGVGELGYKVGISGMLYPLILGVALILSMWLAAARFRRSNAITLQEVLERDYGVEARVLVAVIMILSLIPAVAALAAGAILSAMTGLNIGISIVIAAAIVTLYIFIGGMWAVALTDTLQMIIIYVGLALLSGLVVTEYGGFSSLLSQLPPSYSDWTAAGPVRISSYVAALLMFIYVSQPWLQRCAAVRTPEEATRAGVVAGLLIFPIGFFAVSAGLLARVLLPNTDPLLAVPQVILTVFHPAVGALFCAAIIAACMSSTDSWIHSCTTMLVRDFYQRLINPEASDRRILNISRLVTLVIGLLSLLLALAIKEEVIMLVLLFLAPCALYIGPLFVSWFSRRRRLKRRAGFTIMLVVSILGIVLTLLMLRSTPPQIFGVHAALPTVLAAYALTLLFLYLPWTSEPR